MRYLRCLMIICPLWIVLLPGIGRTELHSLTEVEMKKRTARAGIAIITRDSLSVDMEIGSIAYGDRDGIDGRGGYLSFNDITLTGSIKLNKPITVSLSEKQNRSQNFDTLRTGLILTFNELEINIAHLNIDSITVGPEAGTGKSFGSLTMTNFHSYMKGNIDVMIY